MLGTSIDTAGWPGCGEIDVMENFGTSASMVHGTVHGPGYSGERGITASLDTGAPRAAGFHAYSVCWEPGRIRWYADQTLYHTVTPADLHGRPWVFDHDFYLLINVAVGGRPSQDPDRSTAFPQAMLIDYIRVYTASLGAHALAFRVIPAGYLRRPGPSGVAGALRERRSLSGVAGAIPGAPAPCARLRPAPPGPFSALQSRLH
jgi:beta-glucanase (GH16 family)